MKQEDIIPLDRLRAVIPLVCSSEKCISLGETIQDMRFDFRPLGTPAMTEDEKLGHEHNILMMALLDRVIDGLSMTTEDLVTYIREYRERKEATCQTQSN